jgi:hypothetical protein
LYPHLILLCFSIWMKRISVRKVMYCIITDDRFPLIIVATFKLYYKFFYSFNACQTRSGV